MVYCREFVLNRKENSKKACYANLPLDKVGSKVLGGSSFSTVLQGVICKVNVLCEAEVPLKIKW